MGRKGMKERESVGSKRGRGRESDGEKAREKARGRGKERSRVNEACYFPAVWKIWLIRGCPNPQETLSPGEREIQTRPVA